jgi:hypothetical protein
MFPPLIAIVKLGAIKMPPVAMVRVVPPVWAIVAFAAGAKRSELMVSVGTADVVVAVTLMLSARTPAVSALAE